MKKSKPEENYLDKIPKRKKGLKWNHDEEGNVILFVENTGVFNILAQKFFKRPKVSQIHLEKMGNFIWPLIDGESTVYEIGAKVKEHFGDEAEPLYERLVQYFRILDNQGFIYY